MEDQQELRARVLTDIINRLEAIGGAEALTYTNYTGAGGTHKYADIIRAGGMYKLRDILLAAKIHTKNNTTRKPRTKITVLGAIEDIRRVAKEQGSVSRNIYDKYGKHSSSALGKLFGGWAIAIQAAGLEPAKPGNKHGSKRRSNGLRKEDVAEDIKRVAYEYGSSSTMYLKHGKYRVSSVRRKFGKWNELIQELGINTTHKTPSATKYSDEQLREELQRVFNEQGNVLWTTLRKHCRCNPNTILRRLGKDFAKHIQTTAQYNKPTRGYQRRSVDKETIDNELRRLYEAHGRISQSIISGNSSFALRSFQILYPTIVEMYGAIGVKPLNPWKRTNTPRKAGGATSTHTETEKATSDAPAPSQRKPTVPQGIVSAAARVLGKTLAWIVKD